MDSGPLLGEGVFLARAYRSGGRRIRCNSRFYRFYYGAGYPETRGELEPLYLGNHGAFDRNGKFSIEVGRHERDHAVGFGSVWRHGSNAVAGRLAGRPFGIPASDRDRGIDQHLIGCGGAKITSDGFGDCQEYDKHHEKHGDLIQHTEKERAMRWTVMPDLEYRTTAIEMK